MILETGDRQLVHQLQIISKDVKNQRFLGELAAVSVWNVIIWRVFECDLGIPTGGDVYTANPNRHNGIDARRGGGKTTTSSTQQIPNFTDKESYYFDGKC
jgi:hypothetical protein